MFIGMLVRIRDIELVLLLGRLLGKPLLECGILPPRTEFSKFENGKLFVGDETGHDTSITGSFSLGTSNLNVAVGELILINGTLSESDRTKIDAYLMNKWDLSDRRVTGDFSAASSGWIGWRPRSIG